MNHEYFRTLGPSWTFSRSIGVISNSLLGRVCPLGVWHGKHDRVVEEFQGDWRCRSNQLKRDGTSLQDWISLDVTKKWIDQTGFGADSPIVYDFYAWAHLLLQGSRAPVVPSPSPAAWLLSASVIQIASQPTKLVLNVCIPYVPQPCACLCACRPVYTSNDVSLQMSTQRPIKTTGSNRLSSFCTCSATFSAIPGRTLIAAIGVSRFKSFSRLQLMQIRWSRLVLDMFKHQVPTNRECQMSR